LRKQACTVDGQSLLRCVSTVEVVMPTVDDLGPVTLWQSAYVPTTLSLSEVFDLAEQVLRSSGASELQAHATARSIRDAEADGIRNVGLGYLPVYADHVACGKVVGSAVPTVTRPRPGTVLVDAHHGFAHPAFETGSRHLVDAARTNGIAVMGIAHSYSAGVVGWFVEALAAEGLVALMFANSSSVMAPWGGRSPFFGTNPIAYGVPRADGPPLVADLSSAAVAWVTLNDHAQSGTPIPSTWAFDSDGQPTTDAAVGLAGTIAPAGGHKGSVLALLVDVLAAGLTGSSFSHEASSFGDNHGGPVDVGQLIIAIDPSDPGFVSRIELDLAAMTAQEGVRLPGTRRTAHRTVAERDGVVVPDDLMTKLASYAAHGSPATEVAPT
jgi:(2R)-3-sulfolactate dehydrogenase (NADP+)